MSEQVLEQLAKDVPPAPVTEVENPVTAPSEDLYVELAQPRSEAAERFWSGPELQEMAVADRLEGLQPLINDIMATDAPAEQKGGAIRNARNAMTMGLHPQDLAVDNLIEQEAEHWATMRGEVLAYERASDSVDRHMVQSELQALASDIEALNADSGILETGAEFVTNMLGWALANNDVAGAVEDAFGLDIGFVKSYLSGSATLEEARKRVEGLTDDEIVTGLKKLRSTLTEHSGTFSDNEFTLNQVYHAIEALLGNRVEQEIAKDRALGNDILNIMFSLPVAKAARRMAGLKADGLPIGIGKLPKDVPVRPSANPLPKFSPASIISRVAPKTSAKLFHAAINDETGELAARLGAPREALIEAMVSPRMAGEVIEDMAGLDPAVRTTAADDLIKMMVDRELITDADIAKTKNVLSKRLGGLVDRGQVVQRQFSLNESTNNLNYDVILSAPDGLPFQSIDEALEFAQTNLPSKGVEGKPRVVGRDVTRSDPVIDEVTGADGGFYLKVRFTRPIGVDVSSERMFKKMPRFFSPLANYVDTTSSYIRRFANVVTKLDLRVARAEERMRDLLAPFQSLSRKERDAVLKLVQEGSIDEVEFSSVEAMKRLGGNRAATEGYLAVRRFYKAAYEVRNFQYRERLKAEGYRTLRVDDETEFFVKEHTGEPPKTALFNGEIVATSSLPKGIKYGKLRTPFFKPKGKKSGEMTDYVAYSPGKALGPVGKYPLPYTQGYTARHLDVTHVVEEIRTVVKNGVKVEVPILKHVAKNAADAEKLAAGSDNLRVRRAREEVTAQADFIEDDMNHLMEAGQIGATKHRRAWSELDPTEVKAIYAPERQIEMTVRSIGRSVGLDRYATYMTNKWNKTYGSIVDGDGMPWHGDIERGRDVPATPENMRLLREARAMRDKIVLTVGMDEGFLSGRVADYVLSASEYLGRASVRVGSREGNRLVRGGAAQILRGGSRAMGWASSKNWTAEARKTAHTLFIVMHPFRQWLMQQSQMFIYGGVKHGGEYAASGRWMKETTIIAAGLTRDFLGKEGMDKGFYEIAKRLGIKPNEADRLLSDLKESGVISSIGNHQMLYEGFKLSDGLYDGIVSRGLAYGKRKLSWAGFEFGEDANRIAAFLTVRNKHIVDGTYASKSPLDIGAEAIQVSGNMGRHNRSAFQKGMLGMITQFTSHPTRMLQLMIPDTKWTQGLASSAVDNATKARLAVWNSVMWGAGGVGLTTFIRDRWTEAGMDPDSEALNIFTEGVVGIALEYTLEAATGENADIDVAEEFGPMASMFGDFKVALGSPGATPATPAGQAWSLMVSVLSESPPNMREILGPGVAATSLPFRNFGRAMDIFDNNALEGGEKVRGISMELLRIVPALSHQLQGRVIQKTGEYVNQYGTTLDKATYSEGVARQWFGVNPSDIDAYHSIRDEYNPGDWKKDERPYKEPRLAGKEAANVLWATLRTIDEGAFDQEDFLSRAEALYGMGKILYPNDDVAYTYFKVGIIEEMSRLAGDRRTAIEKLVRGLAVEPELRQEGGLEALRTRIQRLSQSPERDFLVDYLTEEIGE